MRGRRGPRAAASALAAALVLASPALLGWASGPLGSPALADDPPSLVVTGHIVAAAPGYDDADECEVDLFHPDGSPVAVADQEADAGRFTIVLAEDPAELVVGLSCDGGAERYIGAGGALTPDLAAARRLVPSAATYDVGVITLPAPANSISGRVSGLPAHALCRVEAVKPGGGSYAEAPDVTDAGDFTVAGDALRGVTFLITALCRAETGSWAAVGTSTYAYLLPEYLGVHGWTTRRAQARRFRLGSSAPVGVGTYGWRPQARPRHVGTFGLRGEVRAGGLVRVSATGRFRWQHVPGLPTGFHFELCDEEGHCRRLQGTGRGYLSLRIPTTAAGGMLQIYQSYCARARSDFTDLALELGGLPVVAYYAKTFEIA